MGQFDRKVNVAIEMKIKPYSCKERVTKQRHVLDAKEDDSFHRAVGPIIQTAQLFGVLPVSEIFATNVRDVKFRWLRFKVLMAIVVILGASLETGLSLFRGMKEGFDMHVTAGIIFLGSILIGMHLLLALARSWPKLIRLWYRTEVIFLRKPYYANGMTLKWRLRIVGFTILGLALIEHMFYIVSVLFLAHKHIEICKLDVNFLEYAFSSERSHIFDIIPFSRWLIFPLECLNVSMTFCWSFVDVMIMVISIGLATRFNQINDRMQTARGKIMPESYWIEMRCHYLIMTELLRYIDKKISVLILLSCANNLFFICYQLFNSFNIKPYVVTTLYFWAALAFIIVRTLTMLFCAASVHDASLKPLAVLRNVPTKAWTIEVRRFTDFVVHERVALSGRRFFFLTRTLILAMAGTVVTYELVLLDEVDQVKSNADICE